MQRFNSQALYQAQRSLGITGTPEQQTVLHDGDVFQILDINPIARRSLTLAGSDGIFEPVMRNVHAAAGQLSTSIDPYNVPTAVVRAPYPSPMPRGLEVWLIGACIREITGAGTLDTAVLALDLPGDYQGWGADDMGAAIGASGAKPLVFWDSSTNVVGFQTMGLQENGDPWRTINMRLPRSPTGGTVISFFTDVSGASLTVDLQLVVGLFPVALGQDVIT